MADIGQILRQKGEQHIILAKRIDTARANLKLLKIQLNESKEDYESKAYKRMQLERKICNINDNIEREKESTKKVAQETEKIYKKLDYMSLETTSYKLLQMKEDTKQLKYINMLDESKRKHLASKQDKVAENVSSKLDERKKELTEKKLKLKEKLESNKVTLQENSEQITKLEQENLVLKKRNAAILLRLGSQLQEGESRQKTAEQRFRILQEHYSLKSGLKIDHI